MVKINLDSECELVDIEGIDLNTAMYDVKALQVDGEAPALSALADWSEKEKSDFHSIVDGIRIVASVPRHSVWQRKGVSADKKGRPIYELAARRKSARLFFFYVDIPQTVVVWLGSFWKPKGGRKQDRAFDEAAEVRESYLLWRINRLRR